MRFKIKRVEVLAHRNKRMSKCSLDWLSSDAILEQNNMHRFKCRPPHMWYGIKDDNRSNFSPIHSFSGNEWRFLKDYPPCRNRKDIQSVTDPTRDDIQRYPKPCRMIEKLDFEYDEGLKYVLKEKNRPCNSTKNAWFRTQVYFGDTTYKEIKHVSAINTEGLVGSISGYIGFILGYSILQFPNLLLLTKEFIGNIMHPYG